MAQPGWNSKWFEIFSDLTPRQREYRGKPIPLVDKLKQDRSRVMLRKLGCLATPKTRGTR